jgi:hypothetical protein
MCPQNEAFPSESSSNKNSSIKIEINGQEVLGSFLSLSSSGISIRIDSPYKGVRASSSIPYYGMVWKERWFADSNGITERGRLESESLLKELHLICQYVENNLENINKTINRSASMLRSNHPYMLNSSEFSKLKAPLKKRYHLKEIDQKIYMSELDKLKYFRSDYDSYIRNVYNVLKNKIQNNLRVKLNETTYNDIILKYQIFPKISKNGK